MSSNKFTMKIYSIINVIIWYFFCIDLVKFKLFNSSGSKNCILLGLREYYHGQQHNTLCTLMWIDWIQFNGK
jgi:hypothetical protein